MNNYGDEQPAPHAFPGSTGELADLMAESARLLRLARAAAPVLDAWNPLWHKRFTAAVALSRHDEKGSAAALRRLSRDLAETV